MTRFSSSLQKVHHDEPLKKVVWSSAEDRLMTRGLVHGFENSVEFVSRAEKFLIRTKDRLRKEELLTNTKMNVLVPPSVDVYLG